MEGSYGPSYFFTVIMSESARIFLKEVITMNKIKERFRNLPWRTIKGIAMVGTGLFIAGYGSSKLIPEKKYSGKYEIDAREPVSKDE